MYQKAMKLAIPYTSSCASMVHTFQKPVYHMRSLLEHSTCPFQLSFLKMRSKHRGSKSLSSSFTSSSLDSGHILWLDIADLSHNGPVVALQVRKVQLALWPLKSPGV